MVCVNGCLVADGHDADKVGEVAPRCIPIRIIIVLVVRKASHGYINGNVGRDIVKTKCEGGGWRYSPNSYFLEIGTPAESACVNVRYRSRNLNGSQSNTIIESIIIDGCDIVRNNGVLAAQNQQVVSSLDYGVATVGRAVHCVAWIHRDGFK